MDLTFAPLTDLLGLTTLPARGYVTAAGLGLVPLVVIQVVRSLRRSLAVE